MTRRYSPLTRKENANLDSNKSRRLFHKSSLTPLSSKKKHIETPRSSGRRTEAHAYSRSTGKENRRPAISDPDAFWQLGRSVRDGDEESDEEEAGNESDADSDWNEEETLVAFLHDSHEAKGTHEELVDLLEPAFDERSRVQKEEMVEALLPTVRRVREAVKQLRGKDEKLADGFLGFSKVCMEFEEKEVDDGGMAKMMEGHKARLAILLQDLEKRYALREKIQGDIEVKMKAKGTLRFLALLNLLLAMTETHFVPAAISMRERVNAFPKEIEKIIASFDRKSKQFDKEDASTAQKITGKAKDMLERESSSFELF
ncbi:hypothetical protein EVG20_g6250 [Dentipellis fragilis]|uniref:Uncharacterized protein n=1 Tax=Dentipellis fragilis TaxID=205917 RepID=A0A4Y9YPM1_9AGAM|nr:hypothetical protein EVG20_g6250 [Dentipellis fragilis]